MKPARRILTKLEVRVESSPELVDGRYLTSIGQEHRRDDFHWVKAIPDVFLRHRTVQGSVPFVIVWLVFRALVVNAAREASGREYLGDAVKQAKVEVTRDACGSVKVRVCNGLGTQYQLELGTKTKGKVITGVGRACRGMDGE